MALLATAYEGPVEPYLFRKIERACELWNEGEKALAHIHLAYANLPPCGESEALRLFAANELLQSGIEPDELLKAQGFDPAPLARKYNPDQPRVPAGNGRASGQWTSEGGGGVVEGRSAATDSASADDSITVASNDKDKSYEERRARGQETPKEDIEHERPIPLYPERPLTLPPPSAGATESAPPKPKPSDFIGQDFGKLGVGEEKPDLSISGFFDHATEGIAERDVSLADIQDAVSNLLIVLKQSRGRHYYLSGKAAVVLNSEGKVITVYPASHFEKKITDILNYVLGGTGNE